MTAWLGHGPLGSPGAGYGYDGLVLVPFNVHVSPRDLLAQRAHLTFSVPPPYARDRDDNRPVCEAAASPVSRRCTAVCLSAPKERSDLGARSRERSHMRPASDTTAGPRAQVTVTLTRVIEYSTVSHRPTLAVGMHGECVGPTAVWTNAFV